MPIPLAVPLIAGAVGGLTKAGVGISQGLRARKLKKDLQAQGGMEGALTRDYQLASRGIDAQRDLYGQQMNRAKSVLNQGLPSETIGLAQNQIQQSTQDSLRAAGDVGGKLRTIGNVQGGMLDAYRNLYTQDAQMRQQNQQQLLGIQDQYTQRMAGLQQEQSDIARNRFMQPFLAKSEEQQAMSGAAMQNITGGVSDIGQGIIDVAGLGGLGSGDGSGGGLMSGF